MTDHDRAASPAPAQAVARLAGGVAHDLNNILLVAQGYTDMAVAEAGTNPALAPLLREVSTASERAVRLVRDLLLLGNGGQVAARAALLDEAAAFAVAAVPPGGAPVTWLPGAPGAVVRLDEALLRTMLDHLVSWSRESGAAAVTITSDERGPEARICVAVEGLVMPPDALDQLFEPYVRGVGGARGAGLRLAVVRAVAERLGGYARAVPRSAGVEIILGFAPPRPGDAAAPASAAAPAADAPRAPAGARILVAEDDDALRATAVKVLEREGWQVIEARDGQEAVEAFEKHGGAIALVLLDEVMPRLGGRAALARIRALRPGIPAIMASGYAWSLDGARDAAECAVLAKPWRPRELLALVREQGEGRRP